MLIIANDNLTLFNTPTTDLAINVIFAVLLSVQIQITKWTIPIQDIYNL